MNFFSVFLISFPLLFISPATPAPSSGPKKADPPVVYTQTCKPFPECELEGSYE